MDTISRENNSMLPVGGIIVGVIALLLGGYSAITLSKVNKSILAHDEKIAKIDGIESQAATAAADAAKANKTLADYGRATNDGFAMVSNKLGEFQASLTKLEEAAKKPAPVVAGKKSSEPAVAAPGEYIVKSGESGAKIARDHGVSLGDLQAVNPGVNWTKMKVGDKLKLPQKK